MLLRQGLSWSGRERNCCFLNTGDSRFADISGTTGLDFADDGRGLALSDWDFDGDVDFWITNRTGPRLRFMRNDTATDGHFLALRLQGDGRTCNRDAIGARVEAYVLEGQQPKYIKTLRAGEGFVSQSTKWLYFGLGDIQQIQKVVVRWPAGESEEFFNVKADHFWHLRQHSGQGVVFSSPQREIKLAAQTLEEPAPSEQARIVLVGRVPLPPLQYKQFDGTAQRLQPAPGEATLVNLWSHSCAPCIKELAELARHRQTIAQRKLRVVALSVDELAEDEAGRKAAGQFAAERAFPFTVALATGEVASNLEALQRAVLDRSRPLPLPSSFLVDGQGRVAVIYKGAITVEQLLHDTSLLEKSPGQLRKAATPFAGRWRTHPPHADPIQVALKLFEGGYRDLAKAYLLHCEKFYGPDGIVDPLEDLPAAKIADLLYFHGLLLAQSSDADGEIAKYRSAVDIHPDHRNAHLQLGKLLKQRDQFAAAANHFHEALRLDGIDAATQFQLAGCMTELQRYADAIAAYRAALQIQPKWVPAANNLAWILATHWDPDISDAGEALRLAEAACEATNKKDPVALDTLAVAYAANGRFADAVSTALAALKVAHEAGASSLAADIEKHISQFEQELTVQLEMP